MDRQRRYKSGENNKKIRSILLAILFLGLGFLSLWLKKMIVSIEKDEKNVRADPASSSLNLFTPEW
jgi:hypothetical protein